MYIKGNALKRICNLVLGTLISALILPALAANETVVHGQREGRCGKNGVACPSRDTGGGARPSGAPKGGPGGSGGSLGDANDEEVRARRCQELRSSIDKDKWEIIKYKHYLAKADAMIESLSRSPVLQEDELVPLARKCAKAIPCEQRESEQRILLKKINEAKVYRSQYAINLAELEDRINSKSMNLATASCPR